MTLVVSKITGKKYTPGADCVYLSNMVQVKKYLELLGPEHLLDVLWTSEKRPDALVFVWEKCADTARAKQLWDLREI